MRPKPSKSSVRNLFGALGIGQHVPRARDADPTTKRVPSASRPTASHVEADRFCVEPDGTIVVENDCGCNDALLCDSTIVGSEVTVHFRKDLSRMPMCDDCFPMLSARCPIPKFADGPVVIREGSLELHVETDHGGLRAGVARACTRPKPR